MKITLQESTNTFSGRSKIATQFSDAVFAKIEQMDFRVAMNGTEHTHPEFVNSLKRSNDPCSRYIRYQPDGVIASGGAAPCTAYVEAKASIYIEKDAHLAYTSLANMGFAVAIVCRISKHVPVGDTSVWKWDFADRLELKPAQHAKWPIADGWISPRLHENWGDEKKGFGGSGTPYREIELASLMSFDSFQHVMRGRLANGVV